MWPGLVAVPVVVRSGCRNVRSTVGSDHGSAFGRRGMAGAQPADGRVRAGRAGGARGRSGIAGMDPGRYRVLLSVIHIRIIKRTDLSVLPHPLYGGLDFAIPDPLGRYTQSSCPFTDLARRRDHRFTVFILTHHLPSMPVLHAPLAIGHL